MPPPECTPGPELCNGLDDDCDFLVDEGHDDDGDGFTWCGGGLAAEVDCDDSRSDVHPASLSSARPSAPELCDARDNDCDARVDEAPETLCGPQEQCFAGVGCALPSCALPGFECDAGDSCDVSQSPPVCVTGVCSPTTCPSPRVCDSTSGSCVDLLPLDSACAISAQCAQGACVAARALMGGSGNVCAMACCSDSDCSGGRVCWTSARGGRACVLPSSLGSDIGAGALGTACTASSDCRSQRCSNGFCRAACTGPTDCEGIDTCGLLLREDVEPNDVLACGPALGSADVGADCDEVSCASGMCAYRLEVRGYICLGGCHTSSDCPLDMYCGSITLNGTSLQVCEPRIHPGGALSGEACSTGWSCLDLACVGNRCADTCCKDAQCPADFACTPVSRGSSVYEMRCVPR